MMSAELMTLVASPTSGSSSWRSEALIRARALDISSENSHFIRKFQWFPPLSFENQNDAQSSQFTVHADLDWGLLVRSLTDLRPPILCWYRIAIRAKSRQWTSCIHTHRHTTPNIHTQSNNANNPKLHPSMLNAEHVTLKLTCHSPAPAPARSLHAAAPPGAHNLRSPLGRPIHKQTP